MLVGDWGWFCTLPVGKNIAIHVTFKIWSFSQKFYIQSNPEQQQGSKNLFGWSTKFDVNTGSHDWTRYNHFLILDYRSVFILQQQGVESNLLCLVQLHPKYVPIVVSNPRHPDLQPEVGKGSTISRENCFLGNWESERWPHNQSE